jgi:CRP-like cAMP-binding protein
MGIRSSLTAKRRGAFRDSCHIGVLRGEKTYHSMSPTSWWWAYHRVVRDMLELCAHLPEVELEAGEFLVHEGQRTGSIWVLESGSLQVSKDGVLINTVTRPGAVFGEVAVLLGSDHSATVQAVEPCRLRYAEDGRTMLVTNGEMLFHMATGLAERLNLVTTYLADLKNQYGNAPGLAMVSDVLGRLTQIQSAPPRPGSARDPDPEY